jgi:hypothetical protein
MIDDEVLLDISIFSLFRDFSRVNKKRQKKIETKKVAE